MEKKRLFSGFIAVLLCVIMLCPLPVSAEDYWPSGPEVQAQGAVVMEASTGTVLYEKNPHEQLYPASITKIMTTLLALENSSLGEEVTFSYESVHNIDRDSTHIFRDVGEIMTMEQCLYAVMLGSANDCAYAVAEHVGNGYENFIAMMNDKAASLGCKDTHFNNPHGLTDAEHYTSAYDMALIAREAMQNETFRTITATTRYTISTTNKHPDEETPLVNHHKMLTNYKGETEFLYEYCIGGKNGYTDAASNTLVTFAEKEGMTLICVVLREANNQQYTDTRLLMDYCFDNFALLHVADYQEEEAIGGTANTEIFGNAESFVALDPDSSIVLPKTAVFTDAVCEFQEQEDSLDVVALLNYTYAGRRVGQASIQVTGSQVEPYDFHIPQEEQEGGFRMEIPIRHIVIGVLGFIIVVLLGFLIFYVVNNRYVLRHKFRTRRAQRSRYKIIKPGRRTKWRRRR